MEGKKKHLDAAKWLARGLARSFDVDGENPDDDYVAGRTLHFLACTTPKDLRKVAASLGKDEMHAADYEFMQSMYKAVLKRMEA